MKSYSAPTENPGDPGRGPGRWRTVDDGDQETRDDRHQGRRRPVEPGALQPRGHRGQGHPADPRPRPPGRAVRHLPGDGGAVLPLLLLRAAAVQERRGAPEVARAGGHRAVGRHPGDRRGLQAGGNGGVHRRQRARRRHALQHTAALRCRRQPDPAPPQDLADLPRTHGLGAGRRLRAAGRRQRGRAHRLSWRAGSTTTRWPATP